MEKDMLIKVAFDLFGEKIDILEQIKSGKWHEQEYISAEKICTEKCYGVSFSGSIFFDFKTGKIEDTIIRTFVTQFIDKHECKKPIIENGFLVILDKKEAKELIYNKIRNSDRVYNWIFYTALYGIGTFCFFMSDKKLKEAVEPLEKYLKSIGVNYKNEYSEAHWVYRFVFNGDIDFKNKILSEFKL
jgi:hypothetical protein